MSPPCPCRLITCDSQGQGADLRIIMAKRLYKTLPLSAEQKEAINAHCEENGLNFAEETRNYWLKRIGRKDLMDQVKMGRPQKTD